MSEALQLSTAISDLVLAAATWWGVVYLRRRGERYASSGLICVACAATIGAARYGVAPDLASLHQFASSLAAQVGLPLVGLQYFATGFGWPGPDGRLQALGMLIVSYAAFGLAFPIAGYGTAVGGLAMIIVLVVGAQTLGDQPRQAAIAMGGAVLTVVAGLVIGTRGSFMGMASVDAYHYALALSHVMLTLGLPRRYDPPRD